MEGRMSKTAERTGPDLWEKVQAKVTTGFKGGKAGQWSARKAQMAVQEYEKAAGGYRGQKSEDNSLQQWQDEAWGTRSGRKSGKTGERYLPKKAREALSDEEYQRTSNKKRADSRKGKQYSGQPEDVARKTARYRDGGDGGDGGEPTKAELYERARARHIPGRSKMSKAELE
jgi:alkanesulfonate monooxygenase SsuD/methylene tetrahydromethanopterin reductase-like flavin-dependent oxidoreductase (luciferase family)